MPSGACSLIRPPLRVSRPNIFSEEQEKWLGDAQAEMIEPRYRLLPESDSEYLTRIGQNLVAHLPPTSVHFSFHIFESADLKAFSLAGGHVYISRKLVLDAHSEDELAAMLAQEIGRVYIHHAASVATLRFSKMLGVKKVGGQAELTDDFQRLLNIPIPDSARLSEGDQKEDELLADRVGMYALIKAGYSPKTFAAFLDRINLNAGYTGNFFTDLFETTPEVSVRIRQAHKVVDSLPAPCRILRPPYHSKFQPFQDALREKRIDPFVAPTPDLAYIRLNPPMNPALENVRLSLDGKYVLAQDESKIHILATAPLKLLFSIDAFGAEMAQFTPDSADVTFHFDSLRAEDWEISTQEPRHILDFVDYMGCSRSSLSPDGGTFACWTRNGGSDWLRIADLRTGQMIYQNKNFYQPEEVDIENPLLGWNNGLEAWSPDGRYYLATSGTATVGIDLRVPRAVKLDKALWDLHESRFAFVDSNKLVFECGGLPKGVRSLGNFRMCYATFPAGERINTFEMGYEWLAGVTRGASVLTGPFEGSDASLLDPGTGKLGPAFKLDPVDRCGDYVTSEAEGGGISFGKLNGAMETIALPVTPLPPLEAGAFSADGRFLAISDRARGAVWELSTGKKVSSTPPFRAAAFDGDDNLQALFVDQELKSAQDSEIDWKTHKMVIGMTIGSMTMQYGSVLVRIRPIHPDAAFTFVRDIEGDDAASGARLWSRHFPAGAPGVSQADGDLLLMQMGPRSENGIDEALTHRAIFIRTTDAIKKFDKDGLLVEVLEARTGIPRRLVLAPGVPSSHGESPSAALFGDLLAVHGSRNNTVVYRVSNGARLMAFFGRAIAGDAGLGLIAATNRIQDLSIYDVATGEEVQRLTLDRSPLAARFIPEKRQLLVLTATQRVYQLDLSTAKP
jgi:hypothetical protein